jgi:hypothetical protein
VVEDTETEPMEPQEMVEMDVSPEDSIAVDTKEPEINQPAEILTRIKPRTVTPVQQAATPLKRDRAHEPSLKPGNATGCSWANP